MIVRGLPEDCEDAAVVRAAISMAHAMGLAVIGDGVDTEAQRGLLAHWGCDEGQGALFGPVRWLN
jgi:EAL domain-containing protein (putative c-di-GMP-specific phosphodiesterase class I)